MTLDICRNEISFHQGVTYNLWVNYKKEENNSNEYWIRMNNSWYFTVSNFHVLKWELHVKDGLHP